MTVTCKGPDGPNYPFSSISLFIIFKILQHLWSVDFPSIAEQVPIALFPNELVEAGDGCLKSQVQ